MFANLRYAVIGVFSLLVLIILVASVYFKNSVVNSTIQASDSLRAEALAQSYVFSVWDKYYPALHYIYSKPPNKRGMYSQFLTFQNESKKFFKSAVSNYLKVVIYDKNWQVLVDTNPGVKILNSANSFANLFRSETLESLKNKARSKNKTTAAVMPSTFIMNNNNKEKKSILVAIIPIKVNHISEGFEKEARETSGIVEISFDVSNAVSSIENIQFLLIFIMLLSFLALSAIIFIGSHKVEAVVEKQQELSMEMAAAKTSAEEESKAKSQFLANVSHELRTPLNAIIGFSEIMNSESMGSIGNPQYKEFVRDIHTSGVHLLSLINDILDFSKAEENKLDVDLEQVDLTKLVKTSMRMVLPRAEEAKLKLLDDLPSDKHLILIADPKRLKQVLLNLLSNAVKFTPENGEITLKAFAEPKDNMVTVEIRDTGVGMEAQDIARALSPFGQVDNKLSRRYEGTGLGLPLTKKLVELMKGKFDIQSEVGLGTSIILSFPSGSGGETSETPSTDNNGTSDSETVSPAQPTQSTTQQTATTAPQTQDNSAPTKTAPSTAQSSTQQTTLTTPQAQSNPAPAAQSTTQPIPATPQRAASAATATQPSVQQTALTAPQAPSNPSPTPQAQSNAPPTPATSAPTAQASAQQAKPAPVQTQNSSAPTAQQITTNNLPPPT